MTINMLQDKHTKLSQVPIFQAHRSFPIDSTFFVLSNVNKVRKCINRTGYAGNLQSVSASHYCTPDQSKFRRLSMIQMFRTVCVCIQGTQKAVQGTDSLFNFTTPTTRLVHQSFSVCKMKCLRNSAFTIYEHRKWVSFNLQTKKRSLRKVSRRKQLDSCYVPTIQ